MIKAAIASGALALYLYCTHRQSFNRNSRQYNDPVAVTAAAAAAATATPPTTMVPLRSVEELMLWQADHDPLGVAWVPLPPAHALPTNRSRLMHCHDMMGGYVEDAVYQGEQRPHLYNFCFFQHVDVFCYFSHYRVTIPPPAWTNAAHRSGVVVLGTFITEWEEGKAECIKLLNGAVPGGGDPTDYYADQLARLAAYYRFDGWLINIENELDLPDVERMVVFVGKLAARTRALVGPHSQVIWYDAVTMEGKLEWQDELNELNKPFFDACDGIFTNYTWSVNQPAVSAANAGQRALDVWTGTDVWGRNTFGGGGYNSHAALQVCIASGVSSVLFAPAWTYENQSTTRADFIACDARLWAAGDAGADSVAARYAVRPLITALPFSTTFNRAAGDQLFIDGLPVTAGAWSNLSDLSPMPSLLNKSPTGAPVTASWLFTTAFDGVGCLAIDGDFYTAAPTVLPIFAARFQILAGHSASYVFSGGVLEDDPYVSVRIHLDDGRYITLGPQAAVATCRFRTPPGKTTAAATWIERVYSGWGNAAPNQYVVGISIVCGGAGASTARLIQQSPLYFGRIVLDHGEEILPPTAVAGLTATTESTTGVVTVAWDRTSSNNETVNHFDLWTTDGQAYRFVGRAFAAAFVLPGTADNYRGQSVVVQSVGNNAAKQSLPTSSRIVIE